MYRKQSKAALAGLVLMVWALPALGGEYRDPTGFSFTYPDGWVVVTNLTKDQLPPQTRTWLSKNNVDLSRLSMVLIRDGQDEFLENMNVVVDHQEIPVNESALQKIKEMI